MLCAGTSIAWRTYVGIDNLASVIALLVLDYLVYAAVVARFCRVEDEILQLASAVLSRATGRHLPKQVPSA